MSELERKWPSLDGSHSWQNGQTIHILLPNFKLNQVSNKFISSGLVRLWPVLYI